MNETRQLLFCTDDTLLRENIGIINKGRESLVRASK
jgi:hypothetical protein